MVIVGDNENFLKSCGTIHWALMTCVYAIGYFAAYFAIPDYVNPQGGALGLLLYILILTLSNDFFFVFLSSSILHYFSQIFLSYTNLRN